MFKDDPTEECFGPEHSAKDEPDHSWGLDELGERARGKHDEIVQGEKTLAPEYWDLGQALTLARKQVTHGQWESFLAKYGIDRVRACRARTIYRTFSSVGEVSGLTVQDDYDKRQKRQVHRRTRTVEDPTKASEQEDASPSPEKAPDDLDAYLMHVRDGGENLVDAVAFMGVEQRQSRFSLYQAALKRLKDLGRMLGAEDAGRRLAESSTAHAEQGNSLQDLSLHVQS